MDTPELCFDRDALTGIFLRGRLAAQLSLCEFRSCSSCECQRQEFAPLEQQVGGHSELGAKGLTTFCPTQDTMTAYVSPRATLRGRTSVPILASAPAVLLSHPSAGADPSQSLKPPIPLQDLLPKSSTCMAEEGLLSYRKVVLSQKISAGLLAHPLSVSGQPRSLTELI